MAVSSAGPRTHKFALENTTSDPLEVMIEPAPERYVLQPGDKMEFDAETEDEPIHALVYDGGVQIYAGNDSYPAVRINGQPAETNWNISDSKSD